MPEASCLIDDLPVPVERPQSVGEIGDLVRGASANDDALYPLGGRTMLDLGLPPSKQGRGVDMRGLDQVIDYPARDMTITVQAGITVARLQAMLAPENQRLPIDVPRAAEATLGGILATNLSGPRRYGYGTLRDYVLGINVVNDQGQEIKAGGRVVKNVAGYDLCKLYVGSLGTLGIITQATLKLRPLAEEQAVIILACAAQTLADILDLLHKSRTRPVCIDVLNQTARDEVFVRAGLPVPDAAWTILVGFESNAEAVQWQVQQLIREVKGKCTLDARIGNTANSLWQVLTEFAAWPGDAERLTFKANLLPGGIAEFCRGADALPERPLLQTHAGNGIVIGHLGSALTAERAAACVRSLRDLARPRQGKLVVLRCPLAWKRAVDIWGPAPGDVSLMHAVKNQFDPKRVFNPGRFVDGI